MSCGIFSFEYPDSPYNHGWIQPEGSQPVYGFGMGYSVIYNTVLDIQHESRVLDVYRPASIFLLGISYEDYAMRFDLSSLAEAGGIDMAENPVISFDLRTPLGIEPFDVYGLNVMGEGKGETVMVRILPIQPRNEDGTYSDGNTVNGRTFAVTAAEDGVSLEIQVVLERGLLNGEWHSVWVDLSDSINQALLAEGLDPDDWGMEKATTISVNGHMFRLDNIIFRATERENRPYPPHLFDIGPRFAQIFEPCLYLFCADYKTGDRTFSSIYDFLLSDDSQDTFITNPNEIAGIWIAEYGADPDLFGISPDPQVSAIMGREFVIDPMLPIFANPNLRLGKNPCLEYVPGTSANKTLDWKVTHTGPGSQEFLISPLQIDPYDGMPTYIPVYYSLKRVFERYNKSFLGPEECLNLECALWNVGFTLWPNVAKLDFNPEAFEDFVLRIEVSNGVFSDREAFPFSVVNYPVTNNAPIIRDIENLRFYIGEAIEYIFTAIDPDCMIFSMSDNPAASHKPATFEDFRRDMDHIYWTFLNPFDLGCFCTSNDVLDHATGLLEWRAPHYQDVHSGLILSARDTYGGCGIAEFSVFITHRGAWLNHPPIILGHPADPLVARAGEEFVFYGPDFSLEDPDGDQIFTSCNIGSCSRRSDGRLMWGFKTHFPGLYDVEIIFYDVRGGYARMEFQVRVKPWWSLE